MGVIDDACRGGDECAHVARAVVATLIEDHFASEAAVRFCCGFGKCGCCRRQCPCHGVHASCEHVGEPYAVVSILCEPIGMHEHVIFRMIIFHMR